VNSEIPDLLIMLFVDVDGCLTLFGSPNKPVALF